MPQNIPSAALCDRVDINLIKNDFDSDRWIALKHVYRERHAYGWRCFNCLEELDFNWLHLKCVPLKNPPKTQTWYCKLCRL